MTTVTLRTKEEIDGLAKVLHQRKLPLTVTYIYGRPRTPAQNRLQRLWLNEIAEQLGDRTPEEVRGECKLIMGVPILRDENEQFREKYDEIIKPLSYEAKVELMMEPLSFPVTSIMNVPQKIRFLDKMQRHFLEMGLQLTEPHDEFKRDVKKYVSAT